MNANIIGNILVPGAILVALMLVNFFQVGQDAVVGGIKMTSKMLVSLAIPIILAFLITGQAQMIVMRHLGRLGEFLNGDHGTLGAMGAGVLAPSMSSYPIIHNLWQAGGISALTLFGFFLASRLLNFQMVLFYLPFFGWELTLLTCVASLIPLALIFLFGLIF